MVIPMEMFLKSYLFVFWNSKPSEKKGVTWLTPNMCACFMHCVILLVSIILGANLITHNTWIVGILFPNCYKITWQTSKQLSLLKGIGSNLDLYFPCVLLYNKCKDYWTWQCKYERIRNSTLLKALHTQPSNQTRWSYKLEILFWPLVTCNRL
jgi:hypothetical protein